MKFLFCIFITLIVVQAQRTIPKIKKDYESYRKKFEENNDNLEVNSDFKKRKQIYEANIDKINKHNTNYNLGKVSYYLGETPYTDWSEEEFRNSVKNSIVIKREERSLVFYPSASVNYVTQNLVSEIKNQKPKKCSSCTVFAALATIESQYSKLTNKQVSLSEQYLVDCGPNKAICSSGGQIKNHFDFLRDYNIKKIPLSKDYPYTGERGICKQLKNINFTFLKITGFQLVSPFNQTEILDNITKIGPLGAYINSGGDFKDYKGGIIDRPNLCSGTPNHAITIVGFDKHSYIVKNSFGRDWGEKGYFRISRKNCNFKESLIYPKILVGEIEYDEIEPSTNAGKPMNFTIINDFDFTISLYEIKPNYDAVLECVIHPNQFCFKNSFENYGWVLSNKTRTINKCIPFSLSHRVEFKNSNVIINISKLNYFCDNSKLNILHIGSDILISNVWKASDFPKVFKYIGEDDWNEYHYDRLMFRFKEVERGQNYVILYDDTRKDYVRLDEKIAIQGLAKNDIKYFLNYGTWNTENIIS